MSNVLDQLSMLTRGSAVKRFHTATTITTENVGEHSHSVATLVFILLGSSASSNILVAALVHDLAECEYGDIPSPTKRALRATGRVDMDILEDTLLVEAGLGINLSSDEATILRCCDVLSGMLFCAKERTLGNRCIWQIFERYCGYYEVMALPVGVAGRAWEVYTAAREVFYGGK